MRKIDAELRNSPFSELVWMTAFKKARSGWGWLSLAEDLIRQGSKAKDALCNADERLTEALKILSAAGLHNGELAMLIKKSLIQIGNLYGQTNKKVDLWDEARR